jgi:hypothetical protein
MEIRDAFVEIPGQVLDTHYEAVCECGWRHNFGYMGITAYRETDRHNDRRGHFACVFESPAPPLTRQAIRKLLKGTGRRLNQADAILRTSMSAHNDERNDHGSEAAEPHGEEAAKRQRQDPDS